MDHGAEQLFALMVIGLILALVFSRPKWKPNLSAHGQADFAHGGASLCGQECSGGKEDFPLGAVLPRALPSG